MRTFGPLGCLLMVVGAVVLVVGIYGASLSDTPRDAALPFFIVGAIGLGLGLILVVDSWLVRRHR
jgi:drug/metabolite transporter (DMT)-like permease